MQQYKLHEIIAINSKGTDSILIELLHPYKRSLLTYYTDLFCCEPILMVTSIFNAAQYGIIVSSNEFSEALEYYIENDLENEDYEMKESERETISFNSIMLKDL